MTHRHHPVQIEPPAGCVLARPGQRVDGGGDVVEGFGPATAVSVAAVLDRVAGDTMAGQVPAEGVARSTQYRAPQNPPWITTTTGIGSSEAGEGS